MHKSRRELLSHGVLYPGTEARAMRAGWAVIGVTPRGRPRALLSEWQALVDQVRAAPGFRICVSTEDLGRVGSEVAERVVTDLGTERVHVLTVVRRLDRLLPSQWQQRAQSFKTETFEEFLHVVLDPRGPVSNPTRQAFWASHDVSRVLDLWSRLVEPERVIAVVADEDDRGLAAEDVRAASRTAAGAPPRRGTGQPVALLQRRRGVASAERCCRGTRVARGGLRTGGPTHGEGDEGVPASRARHGGPGCSSFGQRTGSSS